MINYDNCWKTMQERGITKYSLIYHYGISSNTLRRMAHCEPKDILSYNVTNEEKIYIENIESEVAKKKKK